MVISDWSSDVCSSDLYGIDGETTDFEISGNYVRTDRTETERSFEYDDPTAISGSVGNGGNLLTDHSNINDIDQENYSIAGRSEERRVGTECGHTSRSRGTPNK